MKRDDHRGRGLTSLAQMAGLHMFVFYRNVECKKERREGERNARSRLVGYRPRTRSTSSAPIA